MLFKNSKKFLTFLFILLIPLFLFGCNNKNKVTFTEIEKALNEAEGGELVKFTGVVYYVVDDGFYLSDSDKGKVYIKTNSKLENKDEIEVGKEISAKGRFTRKDNQPLVEEVSELKVIGEGSKVNAVSKTVGDLNKLNPTDKTGAWYSYVELIGKLSINEATDMVVLTDDFGNQIEFTNNSSRSALVAKTDVRVKLQAVLTEFSSFGDVWRITFQGENEDVVLNPHSLDEVKDIVNKYLSEVVPSEVIGSLELPSVIENIDELSFTWESSNQELIEVLPLEEGELTYKTKVTIPEEDASVKLTVTVSYLDNTPYTLEYNVTSKTVATINISEVKEQEIGNVVITTGAVLGYTKNYTDTVRMIMIQDLYTNDILFVNFPKDSSGTYGLLDSVSTNVKDIVTVGGRLDSEPGRLFIKDVVVLNNSGETKDVNFNVEDAVVLNTQESWENYSNNMPLNALVKFEGPFMRYSTSGAPGPDNWIRLRRDQDASDKQVGVDRVFALNIRQIDEVLGKEWRESIGVLPTGGEPVQFDGSFYAYVVNVSATYVQFAIISEELVIESNTKIVKDYIQGAIPSTIESGNLELPTSLEGYTSDIMWSSSHPEVISDEGVISYPAENTKVTLVATYTVDGEVYILELEITVIGQEKVVLNVSEALELEEDNFITITGLVLSYFNEDSAEITGFLLQDLAEAGKTILVYSDSTDIKIGDIVELGGHFECVIEEGIMVSRTVTQDGEITIVSEGNEGLDYHLNVVEITTFEDLVTYFENPKFGEIIKLSGTIYFNSSNKNLGASSNIRFHMNADATVIGDTRLNGKSLTLKRNHLDALLGESWLEDLLGINSENDPSTDIPGFEYTGELYFFVTKYTGSYYHANVVKAEDINLQRVTE